MFLILVTISYASPDVFFLYNSSFSLNNAYFDDAFFIGLFIEESLYELDGLEFLRFIFRVLLLLKDFNWYCSFRSIGVFVKFYLIFSGMVINRLGDILETLIFLAVYKASS